MGSASVVASRCLLLAPSLWHRNTSISRLRGSSFGRRGERVRTAAQPPHTHCVAVLLISFPGTGCTACKTVDVVSCSPLPFPPINSSSRLLSQDDMATQPSSAVSHRRKSRPGDTAESGRITDVLTNTSTVLDLAGTLTALAPLPYLSPIFDSLKSIVNIANVSLSAARTSKFKCLLQPTLGRAPEQGRLRGAGTIC